MRRMIVLVLALAVVGCATQPTPAVTVPAPPLAEPASASDVSAVAPYRRPLLSLRAPPSWIETSATGIAPAGDIVLVHASGKAIIVVQLRNTQDRPLVDHACRIITDADDAIDPSPVMATAGGDRAWFSWTRPSAVARGRVVLVRFPTLPERMAVISGTWSPSMDLAMLADLNEVAASVILL